MDIEQPLVSVKVLTYNCEDTIEKCLRSVLSQRTNFVYEIVVFDDCSTDNTKQILLKMQDEISRQKEFPKFRLYFQPKNKGVLGNYKDAVFLCNGKYIAGCGCDDYWIDKDKLQKQIDIMEKDASIGMVYTDWQDEFADLGRIEQRQAIEAPNNVFNYLLLGNFIKAPSVIYRKDLFSYMDWDSLIRLGSKMEDYPMWLEFSMHTKFKRLPCVTVNYRVKKKTHKDARTALSQALAFDKMTLEIKKYYINKYKEQSSFSIAEVEDAHNRRGFRYGIYLEDKQMAISYLSKIHNKNIIEKFWAIVFNVPLVFDAYVMYRAIKYKHSKDEMIKLVYS